MPKSFSYKLAKISVLPLDQKKVPVLPQSPGEMVSGVICANPYVQAEKEDILQFGFVGTQRIDVERGLFAGKIVQGREIQWRQLQKDDVTEKRLADHPYCQFYFSEQTQIVAFQSTRINRGIQPFLKRLDRLLSRELYQKGFYTETKSLKDPSGFKHRLENADRIQTIWFSMIPPNAYRNDVTKDFIQSAVAHTRARQIRLAYDPADSLDSSAEIFEKLIEECENGNGNCGASIVPAEGAKTEYIKLSQDRIVRQLTPEDLQESGNEAVRQLLAPSNPSEGET